MFSVHYQAKKISTSQQFEKEESHENAEIKCII